MFRATAIASAPLSAHGQRRAGQTSRVPGGLPRVALAAITAAIGLAACGGSGTAGHKAASDSPFALAQCMRSHGVPSFPDPTKGPGGEGLSISATPGSSTLTVDGITFAGPGFTAAETACKLFGGRSAPPAVSESQKLKLVGFAQCMRRHGVTSYPDPIFPPGGGIEQGQGPGLDRNSPALRSAAMTCTRIVGL